MARGEASQKAEEITKATRNREQAASSRIRSTGYKAYKEGAAPSPVERIHTF